MENEASLTTRRDFEEALDALVCRAAENDIEVADFAYALRHPDDNTPDWEVLITRVTD